MQWGPDADAKLFMHVLKIHSVKLDYNALALAMGNDVTPKALTHRIAKLRAMAATNNPPPASTVDQPAKLAAKRTAPSTAAKRAGAGTGKADQKDKDTDEKKQDEKSAAAAGKASKRAANGGVKNAEGAAAGIGDAGFKRDGGEEEEEEEEGEVRVMASGRKRVRMGSGGAAKAKGEGGEESA